MDQVIRAVKQLSSRFKLPELEAAGGDHGHLQDEEYDQHLLHNHKQLLSSLEEQGFSVLVRNAKSIVYKKDTPEGIETHKFEFIPASSELERAPSVRLISTMHIEHPVISKVIIHHNGPNIHPASLQLKWPAFFNYSKLKKLLRKHDYLIERTTRAKATKSNRGLIIDTTKSKPDRILGIYTTERMIGSLWKSSGLVYLHFSDGLKTNEEKTLFKLLIGKDSHTPSKN